MLLYFKSKNCVIFVGRETTSYPTLNRLSSRSGGYDWRNAFANLPISAFINHNVFVKLKKIFFQMIFLITIVCWSAMKLYELNIAMNRLIRYICMRGIAIRRRSVPRWNCYGSVYIEVVARKWGQGVTYLSSPMHGHSCMNQWYEVCNICWGDFTSRAILRLYFAHVF